MLLGGGTSQSRATQISGMYSVRDSLLHYQHPRPRYNVVYGNPFRTQMRYPYGKDVPRGQTWIIVDQCQHSRQYLDQRWCLHHVFLGSYRPSRDTPPSAVGRSALRERWRTRYGTQFCLRAAADLRRRTQHVSAKLGSSSGRSTGISGPGVRRWHCSGPYRCPGRGRKTVSHHPRCLLSCPVR